MGLTLAAIAAHLGGEVRGEPELEITAVRALEVAGDGDLAFVADASLRQRAEGSAAAALLVPPALADLDRPRVVVEEPAVAVATLLAILHPPTPVAAGIHPTAIMGTGTTVDPTASVGPFAVLGDGSEVGPRAVLHPHVVVGKHCRLAADVVLHPHVVLYDRTVLGARTVVHAGTVLGADGFGYATRDGVHHKVPQVGGTVVEEDVEIGALSAVDRAALEETRIGGGSKIDNLVQVGHNVAIGRGCILCGQVGIAGSATLGNYVVMGGQSGSAGHLEIGDGVQVAGKSAVFQTIPAGTRVGGIPATDLARWRRQVAAVARVGELRRRLRELERRLAALEGEAEDRD